ncbi:Uncharacterised protein [Candidatus Gugararchaeum adminiculabundum]|nr:Uncharacterised protein [Candidatus Gugararchaeum adminiculabundum]
MLMRAQVSLEFLLVFAAFLAVLALILPLLYNSYALEQSLSGKRYAELAAYALQGAADNACVLGAGNTEPVELRLPFPANISASGKNLTVSVGGKSKSAETLCSYSESLALPAGTIRLYVSNEKIWEG